MSEYLERRLGSAIFPTIGTHTTLDIGCRCRPTRGLVPRLSVHVRMFVKTYIRNPRDRFISRRLRLTPREMSRAEIALDVRGETAKGLWAVTEHS